MYNAHLIAPHNQLYQNENESWEYNIHKVRKGL